jgi:hypothetical protein
MSLRVPKTQLIATRKTIIPNVARSNGFGFDNADKKDEAENIEAKLPNNAALPEVKLAYPPLTTSDASALQTHVVFIEVQFLGLQTDVS